MKKGLIIGLVSAVVLASTGIAVYFCVSKKKTLTDITIYSSDKAVSLSFGSFYANFEDHNNNGSNYFIIEFDNVEAKDEFMVNAIYKNEHYIKDSNIKPRTNNIEKYLDVNGYRFFVYTEANSKGVYIEGIQIHTWGMFADYYFIPFLCEYTAKNYIPTTESENRHYKDTYTDLASLFIEQTIFDYKTFKIEVSKLPANLLTFNDEEKTIEIKAVKPIRFKNLKVDKASLLIKCFENDFELYEKYYKDE